MTDTLPVSAEKLARFVPSPELIADLKVAEGLRLRAYRDTLGIYTVGYGHAHVPAGTVWTKAQADAALLGDIGEAVALCDARIPWWRTLCKVRQETLLELMFNMGWDNPRTPKLEGLSSFVNTLAAVKAGDYDRAAAGLLASRWATQVKGRANRIAAQIRAGVRP